MTKKFNDFTAALELLCREHKVTLDLSMYDIFMSVMDLPEGDVPHIIQFEIRDYTKKDSEGA